MNPFELKCKPVEKYFMDWNEMYPQPYDKRSTDPYTKCRIILMNGTEFEGVQSSHQSFRKCGDNDLRREMALCRRLTQQRQKKLAMLKPADETPLEHTISYEQLAVDLTARMAREESDKNVKAALDFALLEDFDHLYRYADLMEMEGSLHAETLVGGYTEITPGRPTIAEHRFPYEAVNRSIAKDAPLLTKLHVNIITAAEQQTMNYYMNIGGFYGSEMGRKLYQEIAMIEEQHVSEYGSLKCPDVTPVECMLMHDYTASYLYYSCMISECDLRIRQLWEECLLQEISHLHKAKDLLAKYEGKDWQQVIPGGCFPEPLILGPNIEYVRNIIATTTGNTQCIESIVPLQDLCSDAPFYYYQNIVNNNVSCVASHRVIEDTIRGLGKDIRFEVAPNPLAALRNRCEDNTSMGRNPAQTPESATTCGTSENCCSCSATADGMKVNW